MFAFLPAERPPRLAPMLRVSRRTWKRLALLLGLLALLWLASGIAVAWKLTRRAAPRTSEAAPAIEWGVLHELRLHTDDG